ncbi:MAG: hypothetical protein AB8H80_05740 [Planctomycetota bacterium]
MNALRALFCLMFAASLLSAQTGAKEPTNDAQAARKNAPHIVIETVGPDGWRARLGPTNIGTMLASEAGRKIWQPRIAPVLSGWRRSTGSDDTFADASARMFAYGGTLRLALRLDRSMNWIHNAALVLEPGRGGAAELQALSKDIRALVLQGGGDEIGTFKLGERTLSARKEGRLSISEPFERDGTLVILAGYRHSPKTESMETAEALLEHLLRRERQIQSPSPNSPALHVHVDMHDVKRGLIGFGFGEIEKAMGLDNLESATFEITAAGPHVSASLAVSTEAPRTHLLAALMPVSQGISPLTQLLPEASATAWKVGRFDLHALANTFFDVLDITGFAPGDDSRAAAEKELGIDLSEDLLAHLSDEVMVTGAPLSNFDRPREASWSITFRVMEQEPFRKAFETMLPNWKPFLSVAETVDVDGVQLRRFANMIGYDVWMATGNGLFSIGVGRDAEDDLTNLLQRAAAKPLGAVSNKTTLFADLSRHLPEGVQGIAQLDINESLSVPAEWWLEVIEEILPSLMNGMISEDQAEEEQEQMRALLNEHNLNIIRTATGSSDGGKRWDWRLYW